MTREELKDYIVDVIGELDEQKLVAVHNEYCDYVGYYDDIIYYMCELDELMCGLTPLEILDRCDDIDTSDDYFHDTLYGVESISDPYDYIYIGDIADEMIDSCEDFGLSIDVDELLENLDDEEV